MNLIAPDKRVDTLRLLKTITGNILNNKDNVKYRKINESSTQFKELITGQLIDKLTDVGFTRDDGHMVWPHKQQTDDPSTVIYWERLQSVYKELIDALSSRISRDELARITEARLKNPQPLATPQQDQKAPVSLRPSRRAKFVSLADIEGTRKLPTHYAEEYLASQTRSKNLSQIINSRHDPEYIGRLALDLTNKYRVSQYKLPLQWDQSIYEVVSMHAQGMANNTEPFSHENFDRRVDLITSKTGSVYSAAENIAMSSGTDNVAETAVDGWIASPGHRANLVGDFTKCAVGFACNGEYFASQIFTS